MRNMSRRMDPHNYCYKYTIKIINAKFFLFKQQEKSLTLENFIKLIGLILFITQKKLFQS